MRNCMQLREETERLGSQLDLLREIRKNLMKLSDPNAFLLEIIMSNKK